MTATVPNTITVNWTSEYGRNYSVSVYLVKQLTSATLLQRLRAKGIRNPDHSRALSKNLSSQILWQRHTHTHTHTAWHDCPLLPVILTHPRFRRLWVRSPNPPHCRPFRRAVKPHSLSSPSRADADGGGGAGDEKGLSLSPGVPSDR
uniref:E3 SUMO-protein ligase PIAS3-like n=1 Tax=Callorhinchus milii TaxID=7868 RepID=A0A4W3GSS3_CALMI